MYQNYRENGAACTDKNFRPKYDPQTRPYACCEMGGGMMCSYHYRFQLPYKSVDAMANVKLGSGCNFLGYYMYQGGSNPLGKNGQYLNESQVCKISYDYQAILGEFGQVRESYRRTKLLHYFVTAFARELCGLSTVLPEGASQIDPSDLDTLRFALRTDGRRGFLFVNNFQDHRVTHDRADEAVLLDTEEGELRFRFGLAAEENCVLPFRMDLDGVELTQATAQPVTRLERDGEAVYVFFVPRGMRGEFVFGPQARVGGSNIFTCPDNLTAEEFTVVQGDKRVNLLVLSRDLAEEMYIAGGGRLVFTAGALLEDENGLRLETSQAENTVYCYPADGLGGQGSGGGVLGEYRFCAKPWQGGAPIQRQVGPSRYTLELPESLMDGVKDMLLKIRYTGDIAHAFLNGRMVSDNFYNGAPWEIGLRELAGELEDSELVLAVTPLKEGASVNVESPMAGRMEEVENQTARLDSVELCPVYEIQLGR